MTSIQEGLGTFPGQGDEAQPGVDRDGHRPGSPDRTAAQPPDIRTARPADASRLTALAHAAKRHWGYSDELISLWQADLTVSSGFIASHPVFCAILGDEIVGFYALSCQGNCCELEHLWVDPAHIGTGVGARLFQHAVQTVRSLGGTELNIVSDPHAEGFYRRMGAQGAGQVPSLPAGRMLPRLTYAAEVDHAPALLEPPASKAPQKGP